MNIVYIRTSTADQTPELQLRDVLPQILQQHDIYTEKLSAWKDNVKRPVFTLVLELIKAGRVKNLYCWDLDRLYRNRLKLKELFQLCKAYGTTIHSYNQQWLEQLNAIPAPFNEITLDLLINLFGWIGQEESKKKSDRVKLSVRKDAKGVTHSYYGNKWGRKSFPKQTVDRVLQLKDSGASIREIANSITVFDKNRNERKISKSAVHKILTSNAD